MEIFRHPQHKNPHAVVICNSAEDMRPTEFNVSDDKTITVKAYAWRFREASRTGVMIKNDAFNESISAWKKRKQKIPMLLEHDCNRPIGTWHKFETQNGYLMMEGTIFKILPDGKTAADLVECDILHSVSISFLPQDGECSREEGVHYTIIKGDLMETSLTCIPAFANAKLKKMSVADFVTEDNPPPPPQQIDQSAHITLANNLLKAINATKEAFQ